MVSRASENRGAGRRTEGKSVGRQGLSDARRGVPRWPGAVALLAIGVSYLALSDYVTVVPRFWLPGLVVMSVVVLLIAQARGRPRVARAISFIILGVVTASLVLREFFLVTTLSGRSASAFSVLVVAVMIRISTVVIFEVWYWEIDAGGPDERTTGDSRQRGLLVPSDGPARRQEGYRLDAGFPGIPVRGLHHQLGLRPDRHARALPKGQDTDGDPDRTLVGGRHRARGVGRRHPVTADCRRIDLSAIRCNRCYAPYLDPCTSPRAPTANTKSG